LKARIILAADVPLPPHILRSISASIHGIKIGLPLLLTSGIDGVKEMLKPNPWDEVILDLKLADIGNTMITTLKALEGVGDAVIAHSFTGIEGSLGELSQYCRERGLKLYLVLAMSHRGWPLEFTEKLLRLASEVDPHGLVVPATKPELIRLARSLFPAKVLISPGVGVQGAREGDALCAGADYEIVGRSIYAAPDPFLALSKIVLSQEVRVNECKGAEAR
jgi:Orotidine-5''-phosphate decarboxylase